MELASRKRAETKSKLSALMVSGTKKSSSNAGTCRAGGLALRPLPSALAVLPGDMDAVPGTLHAGLDVPPVCIGTLISARDPAVLQAVLQAVQTPGRSSRAGPGRRSLGSRVGWRRTRPSLTSGTRGRGCRSGSR